MPARNVFDPASEPNVELSESSLQLARQREPRMLDFSGGQAVTIARLELVGSEAAHARWPDQPTQFPGCDASISPTAATPASAGMKAVPCSRPSRYMP
jgi:hypothetical protein